jgi:hypothetical protein
MGVAQIASAVVFVGGWASPGISPALLVVAHERKVLLNHDF